VHFQIYRYFLISFGTTAPYFPRKLSLLLKSEKTVLLDERGLDLLSGITVLKKASLYRFFGSPIGKHQAHP